MQADPEPRHRRPWTLLYEDARCLHKNGSGSGNGGRNDTDDNANGQEQHLRQDDEAVVHQGCGYRSAVEEQAEVDDSNIFTSMAGSSPLEPNVKARYNEQSWWKNGNTPDQLSAKAVEDEPHQYGPIVITTEFVDVSTGVDDGDNEGDSGGEGDVSSEAFGEDDDSLRLSLFDTERRRADVASLQQEMTAGFASWGTQGASGREKLYFLARFRSRVPLEWWDEEAGGNENFAVKNFVDLALSTSLCRRIPLLRSRRSLCFVTAPSGNGKCGASELTI
ncbi:hypothetical protein MFIFM68171_11320 [Madurella fahalii]|uniref:Uncharacterized protein n=1 Tax=Madurella fahalii TaxID=1157608 RepID=A0ABQ0GTN6_9PEZI